MGAAAAHLLERRASRQVPGLRGAALTVGIVAAEFPDIDVFYSGPVLGMGNTGYLLHHRGHTHTVVFALLAAVVIWLVTLAIRRDLRAAPFARGLLGLSVAGTLSHIALDYTNNYGVHPWWPTDNRWFYGDAIFIVEPWLWIVSLPTLALLARRVAGRVIWSILLVAILAACWRVGLVSRSAALVATVGAVLWSGLVWRLTDARRLMLAFGGWVAVEFAFFATSAWARGLVQQAVGASVVDVVMTPAPGDPFCLRALVGTRDDTTWGVTTATVTLLPGLQSPEGCARRIGGNVSDTPSTRQATASIVWGSTWQAPLRDLQQMARDRCDALAALRFMRLPQWRAEQSGVVDLWDARFGEGGFASVVLPAQRPPCPRWVPAWEPPRNDVLNASR